MKLPCFPWKSSAGALKNFYSRVESYRLSTVYASVELPTLTGGRTDAGAMFRSRPRTATTHWQRQYSVSPVVKGSEQAGPTKSQVYLQTPRLACVYLTDPSLYGHSSAFLHTITAASALSLLRLISFLSFIYSGALSCLEVYTHCLWT